MVNKLFMVAAGHKNSYPSYNKKNKIFFIDKDPSSLELDQPYLCSPIFSLKKEGYRKGLDVNSISEIKFYMIPRVFPSFGYILQSHSKDLSQIWSTIGLANLVVFNFKNGKNLIAEVDESLKEKGCFITASEKWDIENGVQIGKPDIRVNHEIQTKKIISFDYQEDLPDYIKFVISEYKISAQKILDAARVFTPYHYSEYLDIFE
ncbi:MAG: hypothetical protein HRT61_13470, partial [Ekhidna sp.]|nr:hypothetical protein [Ekhidna sp.]